MRRTLLWLPFAVVALDQWTKWLAVDRLLGQPGIDLLPVLRLVLVYNRGMAFGFLNEASGWQNAVFIGVAIVVSIVILVMLARLARFEGQAAVALLLVLGGAFGNMIDRFRFGYVVDFISVHYGTWQFPAFNAADSAITIGAVLLVFDALGWRPGARRETQS